MTEALTFAALALPPYIALRIHRAGLMYSIRVGGNLFYSLAVGLEAMRAEMRRLNEAARGAER